MATMNDIFDPGAYARQQLGGYGSSQDPNFNIRDDRFTNNQVYDQPVFLNAGQSLADIAPQYLGTGQYATVDPYAAPGSLNGPAAGSRRQVRFFNRQQFEQNRDAGQFGAGTEYAFSNPQIDESYFQNQIGGLKTDVYAKRNQTLDQTLGRVNDVRNQLNGIQQQEMNSAFSNFKDPELQGLALEEIPNTSMGYWQLVSRLERQFGPSWHDNPKAQEVLNTFQYRLNQGEDIGRLQDLINQGKQAADYLSTTPVLNDRTFGTGVI